MSILFSAIAKDTNVLAQYATCVGNFSDASKQVLRMMQENKKITYASDPYLFHCISENNMKYFCVTDSNFPQNRAFEFLDVVKNIFLVTFSDTPQSSKLYASANHPRYIDFIGMLESKMIEYRSTKPSTSDIRTALEELKSIMKENVNKMAERGENLDVLAQRADLLSTGSVVYSNNAHQTKQKMWWQYARWNVILGLTAVPMVYFIGAMACGGLKWSKCVG